MKRIKEIKVFGKNGTDRTFSVRRQRGKFYYISTDSFIYLKEINESYKSIYNKYNIGIKPLEDIKIVGRGGFNGYRPFILKGQKGMFLCILEEHLNKFKEINTIYETHIKNIKKDIKEKAKVKAKEKKEEKKELKERREEGKYLYGIIPWTDGKKSIGVVGIENRHIYTIDYKDIVAAVSDVPVKEYSLTEDYMRSHEMVTRALLKRESLIPAAFGQVFKNQKILMLLIKKAYKSLKEGMNLVDNKVELGLKVILSRDMVESMNEKEKKEFEGFCTEIYNTLNKIADESVKGRLFSKRLILNSSFLVKKDKVKNFSRNVEKMCEKYNDMKISYSGPWPPYSFIQIKIGPKGIDIGRKEVM